jgi:hypothetical protein
MSKLPVQPNKLNAIELMALCHDMTDEQVAVECGVSRMTLHNWKQDPNFMDAVYERYMVEFGGELPAVLSAMIREAKAGNVQAGRLVLEHSGKLVKNVNITVDSPFEKWLKKVDVDAEDAEIVEEFSHVEITENLPKRNTESQYKREKEEKATIKKVIKSEKDKQAYNNKRREWYKWKKRADAVGVEPLSARRPTKGQRTAWEEEIIKRESKDG